MVGTYEQEKNLSIYRLLELFYFHNSISFLGFSELNLFFSL